MLLDVLAQSNEATAIYNSESLHIRFVNDAMLKIWGKDKSVTGKTFEQAIPEIVGQPFTALLKEVWRSGNTYIAQKTPANLVVGGSLQTFYFDFEYRAIKNERGETLCILHSATDVTQQVVSKEALAHARVQQEALENEQALNEELAAANKDLTTANDAMHHAQRGLQEFNEELEERVMLRTRAAEAAKYRLEAMVMNTPIAMTILRSKALIVEIANQPMLDVWRRTADQVIGRGLVEIFPELKDQPNPERMRGVLDSGKRFSLPETEVILGTVNGELKKHYARFSYDPIFEADGSINSILVTVINITDEVTNRQKLEASRAELLENSEKLTLLNDELSALNEEHQSTNEELNALNEEYQVINDNLLSTNESLELIQTQLQTSNNKLIENEYRTRSILEQAPVGLCVLRGPEHIIEIANESILKIWGRAEVEVLGKPHHIARPELNGQPVYQWLDDVFATGVTKANNEFRVMLYTDGGKLREAYVNSIYHPLKNAQNEITGVLVILEEITERIITSQENRKTEDMLNLAIQAGELGTFYYDPVTNLFSGNDLLKSWFGLQPGDTIDLSYVTGAIAETDRDRVSRATQQALNFEMGGNYEIDYTIIHPATKEPRIVRAKGKATFNQQGEAISMNGTLQDITESKQDEQRKNDFIGMVSHELKTPLTSLGGYVQILQARAEKNQDAFTSGALTKANNQVKKMTTMINGFLNLSRLESGKIHLDKQRFKLDELVKDIIDEMALITASHTIILLPCNPITIYADMDKIGNVISNLLSNAIKYSPNNFNIEVQCKVKENHALLSVKDNGFGIADKDIEHLFDRYYRVESNHTQTISGFGIGLYLSAEIIERHDGRIWVESEPGKGSTFGFTLPLTEPLSV